MRFRRVLVANRGEIACRVLKTLKAMGISGAAIYSEVDRQSPHVLLADRACCIGQAPARESYLSIPALLRAARELECDAVHPGYGFLSENAEFAAACASEGLVFIGPPVEAIRSMGDKAKARELAQAASVAPVPGYQGADDDATLAREAQRVGYPLLVKAVAGGGGKGMRLVRRSEDLVSAIQGARREALSAFGSETLLLERYVKPARHIEVQVLADAHGKVVTLLERECSLQRRHQKVIEECPSPVVDAALREKLGRAAGRLAQGVGYVGAGTVEFLLDEDGSFWFLEMNTRLQVEHGVTELVTGEDLVAWQIRIAQGEPLTPEMEHVTPHGHAIEARIYAEDPWHGFLPQAGRLDEVITPEGPGVRVDSGICAGLEVSPFYDPMLMKIMAHGKDRESARKRLSAALRETHILGPVTNVGYALDILESESFMSARTFTHTLEDQGVQGQGVPPEAVWWLAASCLAQGSAVRRSDASIQGGDACSPFDVLGAFRLVDGGQS